MSEDCFSVRAFIPCLFVRWSPHREGFPMYVAGKGKGRRWHVPSLQWPQHLLDQERVILELVGHIYFLQEVYDRLPAATEWTLYSTHARGAILMWAIVKVSREAADILLWLRGAQQGNASECSFLNWMDVVGTKAEDFFGMAEAAAMEAFLHHEAYLTQ